MPRFKKGDIVKVVWVDSCDSGVGIQIADIFEVIEDDDDTPFCIAIDSHKYNQNDKYSMYEEQLELVIDPVQQEINELHILLSAQDKKIARLEEIIENQKKAILKLAE